MHNGVLNDYVYGGLSDTQNFIKDFLYDVYYSNLKDNVKNKIIKSELNTSKLIILNANGSVNKYGDFIKDADGVYYSNASYKDRYYYTSKNYCYYDDDFYNDYEIKYDTLKLDETSETKRDTIDIDYDTYYDYITNNIKRITTPQFYCDGYIIDGYKDFNYYVDENTGEIYETSDHYKTASYIGNNYY